jgi:hypothetical protein
VHVAQETDDPTADIRYRGTGKAPLPPNSWGDVEKNLPRLKAGAGTGAI